MAWENYGWVWNVVGIQGSEYNLLIFLADQANGKGQTPLLKVEKIMRRCNLSRRSVFEYIKRLEAKGFVKRLRQLAPDGSWDASKFQLDKTRYFPNGAYDDAHNMWQSVIRQLEEFSGDRINPADIRLLKRITEAFYQRNNKVLYLVTDTDLYEEVLMSNLQTIKQASVLAKQPIRRYEAFRKPFLK